MDKYLTERKIDGQLVYDGTLLKVHCDTVRLPNGAEATREWITHPGAVAVVPVLSDGRIVMVRQYRYPVGRVVLEIPAGKLEPGEAIEQAALRELEEEAGCRAGVLRPLGAILTTVGFSNEKIHMFVAEQLELVRAHPDEDEFLQVVCCSPQQLRQLIAEGKIEDCKTVTALLKFFAE